MHSKEPHLVSDRSQADTPSIQTQSALQVPSSLWTQWHAVHFTSHSQFGSQKQVELLISPSPFSTKLWQRVESCSTALFPCTLIAGWQQQLSLLLAQLIALHFNLVMGLPSFFYSNSSIFYLSTNLILRFTGTFFPTGMVIICILLRIILSINFCTHFAFCRKTREFFWRTLQIEKNLCYNNKILL